MSRVAKAPIAIPSGVEIKILDGKVSAKGAKGTAELSLNALVGVTQEGGVLKVAPKEDSQDAWAQAGTTRALLNNMLAGVSKGFEQKLELVGVGYRAQAKGSVLNLSLGYSHPVEYHLPAGVSVETPTQTEIWLRASDKQLLGQVAANVRGFRPPEPYKGKGIRYAGERVKTKEAKKK
jgi:large subunit ribosomal protein L6